MNKKIIITYIGVGCLLAVLTVWSYLSTQKRMLEVAERTFVEAVHQDLDERWKGLGETITIVSGKDKEVYTNLSIERDSINKSFALDVNNDSLNIDSDINQRMLHTILCEIDKKCNPDTLNGIWQEKLVANGMESLQQLLSIMMQQTRIHWAVIISLYPLIVPVYPMKSV